VFRDYGTTELRTSLVRCVDHREAAKWAWWALALEAWGGERGEFDTLRKEI
jgi:hypothetical protein